MTDKLHRLYSRYSDDLARFTPKLAGQFGCPLCLAAVKPSEPLRDIVAEEHVIPGKLGGRLTTLTCKPCNNRSGSLLEAHLVQRVLLEARKRPAKTTVRIGDAVMRADMHLPVSGQDPYEIRVVAKRTDDRQVPVLKSLLREGKHEIQLGLNFGYIENRSLLALLRSAYLLMFRAFGYRYVLDPSAGPPRDAIQSLAHESPVLRGIVWRFEGASIDGPTVTIVRRPEELASFLIMLPLDGNAGHTAAVTLPPPGSRGDELYERIATRGKSTTVTAQPLPQVKRFIPFVQAWNAICGAAQQPHGRVGNRRGAP